MPNDSLQTSESIVFAGSVSLTTAIVLGIALSAVSAWLMWRERRTVGAVWATLFWLLRTVAIGVALWMLAGPMHETVKRETVRQSIAILADASQSMDTVDPPDATTLLRWTLANEVDAAESPLGHCDSIQVAVQIARDACEQATRRLDEHQPLQQLKQSLVESRVAATSAAKHCQQLIELLDDDLEDFAERVERVDALLQGPIATAFDQLETSLDDDQESLVAAITDTLASLYDNLTNVDRRMETLTNDLAQQLTDERSDIALESDDLSRREQLTGALDALQQNVLADLSETVEVRKFQFDSMLTPVAAERTWSAAASTDTLGLAEGNSPLTDLTAVLNQLASDRRGQATRLAIVLSDGNHTAPASQAPQEAALQLADLPVFTVPVGNSRRMRDLRLHRVEAPATVVENDAGVIDAIVTAVDCDGLAAEVTLRHDGEEIDRRQIAFVGNRVDKRVQFSVEADQLGWQDYEVTVEPFDSEEAVANNVAPVSWEVVRDKFRILLADGISHWEYRYLQHLFRRDPYIEHDELLFYPRLRGTGEMANQPRLPERVEDWAVYDVVILGDLALQQFSPESQLALAEYVRQGQGRLIVMAGPNHMPHEFRNQPLFDLLPVTTNTSASTADEQFMLTLTDEGRLHRALSIEETGRASESIWRDIYRRMPIGRLSEYNSPKPSARTLLRAVPMNMSVMVDDKATLDQLPAFFCWHQVGSGRVVYLAAPEIWKLRFRSHDRRHHRFWGQLVRWITAENLGSGSDLVRLTTDKNRYQLRDPIEVTVWLKDQTGRPLAGQSVQVAVRTLEDDVATAELTSDPNVAGRYFCSLKSLPPGAYEIVVRGSILDELMAGTESENEKLNRTMIAIDPGDDLEMLDTRCDRAMLEQIAELTGGQVVPPTALAEVLNLASLSPEVNETVRHVPLWNRWANLWIVLGCLVVEWIVRKQKGLV